MKENLTDHPEVSEDISITRYGTAAFIAESVTQVVPVEEESESFEERADRILLDNTWGPLLTGLSFVAVFGVLLFLGSWMQDILMNVTERALSAISLGGAS